jgi:ATP-dependent DNA helicase RecG
MIEDTYISKSDLSKFVGINTVAISNNIEAMREKELCRVSPDKGEFWEIIE